MRKNIHRVISILVFIIMLTGIIGCADYDKPAKKVEIVDDFVSLNDIEPDRPDVYIIVKSMDSSYWQVVLDGAKQAGLDLNCNIYAAASKLETEWELQEAYIDLALERKADAIVLGPDNSVMLSAAVDRVHEQGVPIVLVDTLINSDNYDVCYMTDNLLAGERAAKEMIRMLRKQGHTDVEDVQVAIQLGARASQTINERLAGFCQYWTKCAPKKWKLIDEIKCNDGDEDLAVKLSNEYFEQYPNLNGVFGTDNASTMGYSSAIMNRDNTDVILVGFDYSPEVNDIISTGKYNVSVMLQKQYEMGYKGVEASLSIIAGNEIELKFEDTGVTVLNNETINTEEVLEIIRVNRGK